MVCTNSRSRCQGAIWEFVVRLERINFVIKLLPVQVASLPSLTAHKLPYVELIFALVLDLLEHVLDLIDILKLTDLTPALSISDLFRNCMRANCPKSLLRLFTIPLTLEHYVLLERCIVEDVVNIFMEHLSVFVKFRMLKSDCLVFCPIISELTHLRVYYLSLRVAVLYLWYTLFFVDLNNYGRWLGHIASFASFELCQMHVFDFLLPLFFGFLFTFFF